MSCSLEASSAFPTAQKMWHNPQSGEHHGPTGTLVVLRAGTLMGKLLAPQKPLPSICYSNREPPKPSRNNQLPPIAVPTRSDAYDSADPFSSLWDFGKGIVD